MNEHVDLVCPHCKKDLRIGTDILVGCHVWCPFCRENLEFRVNHFVALKSKAYGWLRGHGEWHLG